MGQFVWAEFGPIEFQVKFDTFPSSLDFIQQEKFSAG